LENGQPSGALVTQLSDLAGTVRKSFTFLRLHLSVFHPFCSVLFCSALLCFIRFSSFSVLVLVCVSVRFSLFASFLLSLRVQTNQQQQRFILANDAETRESIH
jgi:hypothetical protein